MPGFKRAITLTACHRMLLVFAKAVANLDSQFLPFGPRNLRNSGRTPSAPAAVPLLITFNAISVSKSVNLSINGIVSSHCFSSLPYDFLACNFSCLLGLIFYVLKRMFEMSFAVTPFSFLTGTAAPSFLKRAQLLLHECVKSSSCIAVNNILRLSSSRRFINLCVVTSFLDCSYSLKSNSHSCVQHGM